MSLVCNKYNFSPTLISPKRGFLFIYFWSYVPCSPLHEPAAWVPVSYSQAGQLSALSLGPFLSPPFLLLASCQVSSFWCAFTSLNDIWQQWKATENCLLIRAKLVDGTDEAASWRRSHTQVRALRRRPQALNGTQLHYLSCPRWGTAPRQPILSLRLWGQSLCAAILLLQPDLLISTANHSRICPDRYMKGHWNLNWTKS